MKPSLCALFQPDGINQTPPSKVTLQCQGLSVTLTTAIGGLILKTSVVFDSMNLESELRKSGALTVKQQEHTNTR